MTSLPHEALLSTFAEMSIAVVGFSMVVGILRPQSRDDEERLFTLRDVAEIGLICAVMSAFPLVVHGYGIPADSTWRLASGAHGVWAVAGITASVRRRGSAAVLPIARKHWFTASLTAVLVSANFALVVTNLTIPSSLSGARYVSCMLLLLTQSGFMFLLAAFDLGKQRSAV